jgi:DNA ligase-1
MMRAERLPTGRRSSTRSGLCGPSPSTTGFRLQAHYRKGKGCSVFRSLEEVSYMYPDIIEGVKNQIKAGEAIIEGEAIGYDPATGSFLPFQETVQRKRKYGIAEKAKEIPLKYFAFELLYADGVNYVHKSFTERKKPA